MTLVVDLACTLEHRIGLIRPEEMSSPVSLVVSQLVIDQEALDLLGAVEGGIGEALALHEAQQVVVCSHLDVLLVQSSHLREPLHEAVDSFVQTALVREQRSESVCDHEGDLPCENPLRVQRDARVHANVG